MANNNSSSKAVKLTRLEQYVLDHPNTVIGELAEQLGTTCSAITKAYSRAKAKVEAARREAREVVCVGWDGHSLPIHRFRDELHLPEHQQTRVFWNEKSQTFEAQKSVEEVAGEQLDAEFAEITAANKADDKRQAELLQLSKAERITAEKPVFQWTPDDVATVIAAGLYLRRPFGLFLANNA